MAFQKAISVRVYNSYLALLYAIRQEQGEKVNAIINKAIAEYLAKEYNCEAWRLHVLASRGSARQFLDEIQAAT